MGIRERGLIMRNQLIEIYLDYWNNYLTYERYAECNGLHIQEAQTLINLAREVYIANHPEA
jgi:hypothetical protein